MNYSNIGLLIGLEIHQQLDTHKLFCNCESVLSDEITDRVERRLRPAQSELGGPDDAAVEEAKRDLSFVYQVVPNSCLVELDEEPPHAPNSEAIEIALQIVGLLNAKPVDEFTFMRKLVSDGSNPAGFQRTGLLAYDGELVLEGGLKIGIPTITLEEDAGRRIETADGKATFRLDRLGIPEIEITTEPITLTPQAARDAAKRIGEILRATGRVRHGIGTIRQDINISIQGGARCEIKLVQDLNAIPKVIELEIERQQRLLEAKAELEHRGITQDNIAGEFQDLTDIFRSTESKLLGNIVKNNGKVFGFLLRGFKGLFLDSLGPELAYYARTRGVKGLFHTDELPGFGISSSDVEKINQHLETGPTDGFVLVGGQNFDCIKDALAIMVHRAKLSLDSIPNEVRGMNSDGTTFYHRPLPGAARMYPETDVPPLRITDEMFQNILTKLPELPDERLARIVQEYGLPGEQAKQLMKTDKLELFEELVKGSKSSKIIAQTLLNTLPELKSERIPVERLKNESLKELFDHLEAGKFAKEAIPEVLKLVITDDIDVPTAISKLGIEVIGEAEIESVVNSILSEPERKAQIEKNGLEAFGPLMGVVMGKLRGKADGKLVSQVLKRFLKELI